MAFNVRVKQKRDEHSNWLSVDPVILDGEIILVDINGEIRQKVGDGVSRYSALPFVDATMRAHMEELVSDEAGSHGFRYNASSESLEILSGDYLLQIPMYVVD